MVEEGLHDVQPLGMIHGQIQEVWKPRLGRPSWSHKRKLHAGLAQLGKNPGEKLMRREAYNHRSCHGREKVSTTRTLRSGTGDTKVVSLAFHLVEQVLKWTM